MGNDRCKSLSYSVTKPKGRSGRGQASVRSDRNHSRATSSAPTDDYYRSTATSTPGSYRSPSQTSAGVAKSRTYTSATGSTRGQGSRLRGRGPGSAGSRGQSTAGSSHRGHRSAPGRGQGSAKSKSTRDEDELQDYDEYAEQDVRFINIPSSLERDDQLGIEFVETPRDTSEIVPQEIVST